MNFPFSYGSYSFQCEISLSKDSFQIKALMLQWYLLCRPDRNVRKWGASISTKLEWVAYTPDVTQQDLTWGNAGKNLTSHSSQITSAKVSEVACVNVCVHAHLGASSDLFSNNLSESDAHKEFKIIFI